jgi:hypothetical protein
VDGFTVGEDGVRAAPLTRRGAARRGAVAGVLWAAGWTVAMSLLAGGIEAPDGTRPGAFREVIGPFAPSASELGFWLAVTLPAAAGAGALTGLAGRRLRVHAVLRVLLLWGAFYLAVALCIGPTMVVFGNVVELAHRRPVLAPNPLELLGLGLFGTVLFAPALAMPLLLAAITVERRTRPGAAAAGATSPAP